MVWMLNRSLTSRWAPRSPALGSGSGGQVERGDDGGREGCRRAGVGEDARDTVLDVGGRAALPGRHHDQPGRHRLEDRDAELLLEARRDVHAARTAPIRAGRSGRLRARWRRWRWGDDRPAAVRREARRPEPPRRRCGTAARARPGSGCSRSPPTTRRLHRAASSGWAAQACTRVAMPLTGCSRPTVRARGSSRRSGGSVSSRSSRSSRASSVAADAYPPCDRGRDLAGRPVERHGVDALGHHRDATALALDVDAEQVPEVRLEGRTGEDDQLRRLLLELAQQEDPEHEVLDLVDAADVLAGQRRRPPRATATEACGIGSQGQHHGHAEVARRLGCGPGADVGHAQVEHVDLSPRRGCAASPAGWRPAAATPRQRAPTAPRRGPAGSGDQGGRPTPDPGRRRLGHARW